MTFTRTEEGLLEHTNLKSVPTWSEKTRTVLRATTVRGPITVSKSFTIQTSTRPSSARLISRWGPRLVNTRSTVRLRTMKVNFPLNWSKSTLLIWISICSTSRLFGARTVRMTMTVKSVSMRTTGRTFAGGPPCSSTHAKCARTGKWTTSSALTPRVARISINAYFRMAGKSKNTIQTS